LGVNYEVFLMEISPHSIETTSSLQFVEEFSSSERCMIYTYNLARPEM